jgi:5-methyltetrahydropteroyltriglutamate--homocysteine methyltransferase
VLDLSDNEPETADTVARRIEAALQFVPADRLQVAPDCGMKYFPRERPSQSSATGSLREALPAR